ncbi:MAG: FIST C-terminal domain-containing protein [Nitrospinae bacterium]|nr:FIST C-terminal domain-containing protein [Nitrospinota bacterium]
MQFASALSHETQTEAAVTEVLEMVARRLSEKPVHLSFVFASPHHLKTFHSFLPVIQERFATHTLLGCTGGGVIGDRREIENQPGLALLAAHLPGVTISPFHIEQSELAAERPDTDWQQRLSMSPAVEPAFALLADPFTIDVQKLLEKFNNAFPERTVLGGLASGGQSPDSCALFLNGEVLHGAVGVALKGNFILRTVVSQGCKPIGQPQVITRGDGQIIYELGGRQALVVVRETLAALSAEDRALAQTALLMGRVIDEYKADFSRGDFLIRTLMGADPNSGAIAVGDRLRSGQTVQLHVRDAATAREDLQALIGALAPELAERPAHGALVFSCNGRGAHLYGEPDYDSRVIAATTGAIPTAGFFCNGEIGPIGHDNFLHGFTASVGIFQEKD